MKTTRLLLVFLCGLPGILFSQNWQNICSPGTTFYSNSDTAENVIAFRLDSTLVLPGPDTAFFSYRTIHDSLDLFNCLDTTGGSVLGEKVILTHNGWYWFFNRNEDTIKINTLAVAGQSWRFCNLAGGGYITATVSSSASENVLGQTDQVRTISLQAKDQSGTSISHPLNDQPFKLSQHYGLVTFFDVYFLPEQVKPCSLAGKSDPPLGAQDFGWREIYDFAVGDEFHYRGFTDNMGGKASWKTIKIVLGKVSYGNDSVDYTFDRCFRMEAVAPPPNVTTFHDTVTMRYNFLELDIAEPCMSLPGELVPRFLSVSERVANRYTRRSGDFNSRHVKSVEYDYYHFDFTGAGCWSISLWENWQKVDFAPGLGTTAYKTYEMWYQTEESLVYFNCSGETWGTPVAPDCQALVGIEDHPDDIQPLVNVFPNPAQNEITVTLTGSEPGRNNQLSLHDRCGRQVVYQNLNQNTTTIAIGNLPRGLYLWKVTDGSRSCSGKLILE